MRCRFLLPLCFLLALVGCSGESSDQAEKQQQRIQSLERQADSLRQRTEELRDSLRTLLRRLPEGDRDGNEQEKLRDVLLDNRVGIWAPDEQAMHIRFADSVDAETAEALVDAFNDRFAGSFNPTLRLQSVDGAVARVAVSDDTQLTEQMGTTGSGMYLATMTYTLTSLCPIDSVYLDVEQGSHAGPGYYSRKTWLQLVEDDEATEAGDDLRGHRGSP